MDDALDLKTRAGLPDSLRALLEAYPREAWQAHPNFAGLVAFWLDRHMMFRRLTDALARDAKASAEGRMDPAAQAARLSRFGGMLVDQLHGHHQIEDTQYFPVLSRLETRLDRGFAILDRDHHALDGLLGRFTESANALLQGRGEAGAFLDELGAFEGFLNRHLEDEEDLVVPVILKHGPDGLH